MGITIAAIVSNVLTADRHSCRLELQTLLPMSDLTKKIADGLSGLIRGYLRAADEASKLSQEDVELCVRDLRTPDSPYYRGREELRGSAEFDSLPSMESEFSVDSFWGSADPSAGSTTVSAGNDNSDELNYLRDGVRDAVFQRVIAFNIGNQIAFSCAYCGEAFARWKLEEDKDYSDDFCNEVVKRHLPHCQGLMQVKERREYYLKNFPKHRKVRFD